MTGAEMPVAAALGRLIIRKENYYDPEVTDAFIKVLNDSSTDMETELPDIEKSWKTSTVLPEENQYVPRPVIEVPWSQLKPGMEIEGVYFENKPFIRNCIINEKHLHSIAALRANTGKNPVVKIRLGARMDN